MQFFSVIFGKRRVGGLLCLLAALASLACAQPAKNASDSVIKSAVPSLVPASKANAVKSVVSDRKPLNETLRYNISWPSGLILGEGSFITTESGSGLWFTMRLDASLPGFAIAESVQSHASPQYCSIGMEKKASRGAKKIHERLTFSTANLEVTREGVDGGGKSTVSTPSCAKDALTYLFFARHELAQGRLPAPQKVFYGAAYTTTLTFQGTQPVKVGGETVQADKILISLKGPASSTAAEMYLAHDAVRTPLLIVVPFSLGKFRMELAR